MFNFFVKKLTPEMPNGPELWDKVYKKLSPYYHDMIIAGGCVRDYYLEVPPKDIDVFCYGHTGASFPWKKKVDKKNEYKTSLNNISEVFYFDLYGYQINIIKLSTKPIMEDLIKGFDLNICKSAYVEGLIKDTPEAKYDRENKIVTVSNLNGGSMKQLQRFERFNKRHMNSYKIIGFPKMIKVKEPLPEGVDWVQLSENYLNKSIKIKVGLLHFYEVKESNGPTGKLLLSFQGFGNHYILSEIVEGGYWHNSKSWKFQKLRKASGKIYALEKLP